MNIMRAEFLGIVNMVVMRCPECGESFQRPYAAIELDDFIVECPCGEKLEVACLEKYVSSSGDEPEYAPHSCSALSLAEQFHATYERLAPEYG